MTASVEFDPKHSTGYRLEQLAAAFDRVRDSRDWKAPIRAEIRAAEQPVDGAEGLGVSSSTSSPMPVRW